MILRLRFDVKTSREPVISITTLETKALINILRANIGARKGEMIVEVEDGKVREVEEVFRRFFPGSIVRGVEVESSVPPQPLSMDQTVKGAVNRAVRALRSVKGAEYGVGVEAGLIEFKPSITGYLDVQLCAIVDLSGRLTLGTSSGFEFPPEVVRAVISGEVRESEVVFERISGISGIGSKMGAIGYLTRGYVSRLDLTIQAVTSALIPRINEELYGDEWPRAWEE